MFVQIKSARLKNLLQTIFAIAIIVSFGTIIENIVRSKLPGWAIAEVATTFPASELIFCVTVAGYFANFARLGTHDRTVIPRCWGLLVVNRASALLPFCWLLWRYSALLGPVAKAAVIADIIGTLLLAYLGARQLHAKVKDILSRPAVYVRWADENDLEGVAAVDQEVWGSVFAATKEQLQQRLSHPKTTAVAVDGSGSIVAFCTILRFNEGDLTGHTWNEITGNGTLSTHNPQGKWVYGAGLACTKAGSKSEAGDRVLDFLGFYMVTSFTRGAVLGARIPGYHKYHDSHPDCTPEQYCLLKRNGKPRDPELSFYWDFELKVPKRPVIIREYMDGADAKSEGLATLIWWRHPLFFWVRFPRLTQSDMQKRKEPKKQFVL